MATTPPSGLVDLVTLALAVVSVSLLAYVLLADPPPATALRIAAGDRRADPDGGPRAQPADGAQRLAYGSSSRSERHVWVGRPGIAVIPSLEWR
ncbi:MAG TPA: hypothetical protein VGJ95_05325 [Pseudonocardiaceae bacterium]